MDQQEVSEESVVEPPSADSQDNGSGVKLASENGASSQKKEPDHLPFIEDVVKKIPLTTFMEFYRITPRGLFFDTSKKEEIIQYFRDWHKGRTSEDISDDKLLKKLFGHDKLERFYLLEGKKCLYGHFVEATIQNPPQYRVPYYLGTPNSAVDYLHPSDPLFTEVEGIRASQGKNGLEITVTNKDKEISVPLPAIRYFIKLSHNSKRVEKSFPQATDSLSDGARAFIHILRRARRISADEEPLRPLRFEREGDKLTVLQRSGFYFLINNRRVVGLYHGYGKNFHFLVRDEMAIDLARATKGRIGSFEIFHRKNKNVGALLVNGVKHIVRGAVITDFIKATLESPAFIKQPNGAKTIRHYIEQFIEIIQTAQAISPDKVSSYLKPAYRKGYKTLVNDAWIFVISQRREVITVVSRTSKNRREDGKKR